MHADLDWFVIARYGLFVHYGLYSLLGRGEWVKNREAIPDAEYAALADAFTAERFDADDLLRCAKAWGMRYAVLTTKHHDGFCLFDSRLTDFTAVRSAARRDLVAEYVAACRKHALRVGLYYSLNDWSHSPNSVDALERPSECYQPFLDYVHGQVRELMTRYGKIDVLWYDGWWPFPAAGWGAEKLNAMVRDLQPGILLNDRTGLPGDFATHEGRIGASDRPWESCMTTNGSWGYCGGDHDWKSPAKVAATLAACSAGGGNLLMNVGPRPDGSIPAEAIELLDQVGVWLAAHEEAIRGTDRFLPMERGDWDGYGPFTAAGNNLYWHVQRWADGVLVLSGLKAKVLSVTHLAGGRTYPFRQAGERVIVDGLPRRMDMTMPAVFRLQCDRPPRVYRCGGIRRPRTPHVRYDPVSGK